ncbi:hypothetical protein QYE76_013287 [Lolium multiflorum]|uniref:Uncharacterized protein n=1 Tax=Lolium multiflorum TaxID=4521 RepID=A0AAD8X5R6_LOLMU|nr:hypothetical protein QYE76_013287 [Lolium multiflorum]
MLCFDKGCSHMVAGKDKSDELATQQDSAYGVEIAFDTGKRICPDMWTSDRQGAMQEMVMAGAVKLREVVWNGYGKQSSTPRSSMVLSSYSLKSPLSLCHSKGVDDIMPTAHDTVRSWWLSISNRFPRNKRQELAVIAIARSDCNYGTE